MFGELLPIGGGDPIPLFKKILQVGRRESCDIVLRFGNVSAHHCQLTLNDGYWYVRDSGSRNGIKVNGVRCEERRLDPGDTLSVAKHDYEIVYSPSELGAVGPPPVDADQMYAMPKQSLLERAGLAKPGVKLPDDPSHRYDVLSDAAGQIKDPNRPT